MPDLGKKYNCYSCHTKFYDLGKPAPICPKCGADQRDAEEAPVHAPARGRRAAVVVVEEPVDEPDFAGDAEGAPAAATDEDSEEEDDVVEPEPDDDADDDDEEY